MLKLIVSSFFSKFGFGYMWLRCSEVEQLNFLLFKLCSEQFDYSRGINWQNLWQPRWRWKWGPQQWILGKWWWWKWWWWHWRRPKIWRKWWWWQRWQWQRKGRWLTAGKSFSADTDNPGCDCYPLLRRESRERKQKGWSWSYCQRLWNWQVCILHTAYYLVPKKLEGW